MPTLSEPPSRFDLETLARPLRDTSPREMVVAAGLHVESAFGLYHVYFETRRIAALFVHPAAYPLGEERILKLDEDFHTPVRPIITRKFKDASLEDLDEAIVTALKPLVSFMDYRYNVSRTPVVAHLFQDGAEVYMKNVLSDIRI